MFFLGKTTFLFQGCSDRHLYDRREKIISQNWVFKSLSAFKITLLITGPLWGSVECERETQSKLIQGLKNPTKVGVVFCLLSNLQKRERGGLLYFCLSVFNFIFHQNGEQKNKDLPKFLGRPDVCDVCLGNQSCRVVLTVWPS